MIRQNYLVLNFVKALDSAGFCCLFKSGDGNRIADEPVLIDVEEKKSLKDYRQLKDKGRTLIKKIITTGVAAGVYADSQTTVVITVKSEKDWPAILKAIQGRRKRPTNQRLSKNNWTACRAGQIRRVQK